MDHSIWTYLNHRTTEELYLILEEYQKPDLSEYEMQIADMISSILEKRAVFC